MLDLKKIPNSILSDIRERGFSDADIAKMSAKKAFDEYLHWNGIIGYARLYDVVHDLDEASSE